jgi:hypothetical protein
MSDDRKYRQRGYQDDGRKSERQSRGPQPPRPQPEGPRGRGLGAPTETVFRCAACGEKVAAAADLAAGARCPRCGADLHSCANCISFDTSSHWECRRFAEIPRRVEKKRAANDCPLWTAKAVQEFGRDRDQPSTASPTSADAARAAFDALFKR